MLRTFMSGFSQQAGKMVAEVVVQMAMQTKTAQNTNLFCNATTSRRD